MTEVRIPAPVKARLVDSLVADDAQPGDFKFFVFGYEPDDAPPAGLNFVCPCGCKGVWGISFRTQKGHAAVWTWNGNREAPDCNPSIQTYESTEGIPPHWHGYLRNGEFIQA